MLRIGEFEAKDTLDTLLDRVNRGEEIMIIRHGKPVARLVPIEESVDLNQSRGAIQRIRERAKQLHSDESDREPFDWTELKNLRDHGRL